MGQSSFDIKTTASSLKQKLRLRRMPAIADLKAIFRSERTSRSVSGGDVASSTILAAQIPPVLLLPNSTIENRRLTYDLLTGRSHPTTSQTSILAEPSFTPQSSLRSETITLSEHQYARPSNSASSFPSSCHKTDLQRKPSLSSDPANSPSIQRTPSDKVRKHAKATNHTDNPPAYTSTSTDRAVKRWRRKHVMVGGQLYPGLSSPLDDETPTTSTDLRAFLPQYDHRRGCAPTSPDLSGVSVRSAAQQA